MSQAIASEAPAPAATPLIAADDRLRQRAHRADDRVVALADLDAERRGVGLEPLAQVLAGAERTPGAGEDHGANGRVALAPAGTRRAAPASSGP